MCVKTNNYFSKNEFFKFKFLIAVKFGLEIKQIYKNKSSKHHGRLFMINVPNRPYSQESDGGAIHRARQAITPTCFRRCQDV